MHRVIPFLPHIDHRFRRLEVRANSVDQYELTSAREEPPVCSLFVRLFSSWFAFLLLLVELQSQATRISEHYPTITNAVNESNDRRSSPPRPSTTTTTTTPSRRLPLVDSDLLRFLSNQQQKSKKNFAFLNLDGQSDENVVANERSIQSQTKQTATRKDTENYRPNGNFGTDKDDNNNTDSEIQQWLQMYQRESILQLLLLQSQKKETNNDIIDPILAETAAEAVQALAMERASRRRIRKYLQRRNQIFNQQQQRVAEHENTSSDNRTTTTTTQNYYESNQNTIAQNIDLLLNHGLSTKDVAEILVHTPGVAFMQTKSLQETVQRILEGLLMGKSQPHHLGLRKYDARKVLRTTPGLLSVRGAKSAEDVVILLTRLGVTSNSISRQIASLPMLLTRPPEAVFRLVAFLASDAVRMPMKNIGPLLRRNECQPLLDAVAPATATTMTTRTSSSSSSSAVEAQIRRAVVESTYRRMSTTAWTLRHEIGTADLGKLIAANPSVLLLDATRQILPIANYLMEDLGIWDNDLPRVLQQLPALLSRDLEQIKLIVSYLRSLEVAPENLGVIIRSFPHLLTLDIEHDMIPVVNFLRNEIGINNVGRFVTRLPPVLGYSVEKELIPKWNFLNSMFIDARFEVSKFPAYFSYPLERVIKSRFEYLKDIKKIPIPLMVLDQVLRYGDRDFAIKIARDPDGNPYATFAEARRKRMSKAATGKEETTSKKNNGLSGSVNSTTTATSRNPSSIPSSSSQRKQSSSESNFSRPRRQSPPPPETPPLSHVSS